MTLGKGWVALIVLCCALIAPSPCKTAVTGTCSSCHTMHNSMEGKPVAFTRSSTGEEVKRAEPFINLLKTDCLGCHTNPGSETIVNVGDAVVPVVFNILEPTYPPVSTGHDVTSTLAGGNFYWFFANGDEYGHNVYGISNGNPDPNDPLKDPDARLSYAPGGVDHEAECADSCHKTLATPESGCQGCHVPMHHADSAGAVAGQGKGWFRFLGSVMQHYNDPNQKITEGVVGIETSDWEQQPTSTNHNIYQGKYITPPPQTPSPADATYTSYLDSGSISQKCIGCHKQFHEETIAGPTWIRHPVSVKIPDSGEFTNFTTYDPMVPVERPDVTDANVGGINLGSDLVSCISCHRAHGSPYPAMLRWNYREWPGIDPNTNEPYFDGCAVCHTNKS